MSEQKTVAFYTLGCRLNMAESGQIAQGFVDRGFKTVDFGDPADVIFLNTCTVTDSADSTCRNLIRKAQRSAPEATLVVAGCYAQMNPKEIAQMKGVDLVLGTNEKYKVFDYLDQYQEEVIRVDRTNEFWGASTTLADSHTRAFLKIQDGCNYVCSFCIIPFARGRSRAIGLVEALAQVRDLVNKGFKEIVLTGVNIGEYEEASGVKLSTLISEILKIDGVERFRLSSVEPNTITDELIEVLKSSSKVMDHFHIPLQSGDDGILKNMRRKYTVDEYKVVVSKIKNAFPACAIGADVIVGFPGETEEQFENTFKVLRELPITHFHIFPYSKRQGTTASKLSEQIHYATKKNRVRNLISFGEAKLQVFAQDNVGRTLPVLFEKRNKNGLFEGYTPNYLRVSVDSIQDLSNQIHLVQIDSAVGSDLTGKIIPRP